MLLTMLFAGGALFIKYKLEGLRAMVQAQVESRTGAKLQVGSVQVNGLRGLRIDALEASLESSGGAFVRLAAPSVYININLADLLYGKVTVERLEVVKAILTLERPLDRPWLPPAWKTPERHPGHDELMALLKTPSFRVVGKDCTLDIVNLIGTTKLSLADFQFDVSRLSDLPDISAKLSGRPGNAGSVAVSLRYVSMEDFDLRVQGSSVTVEEMAAFFPASQRFMQSGSITPTFRIAGYPGQTLVMAFETAFDQVAICNQPDFIKPLQGKLSGLANYESATHLLTLTAAKVDSAELGGRVEGTLSFADNIPAFDIKLVAERLPVTDAISYLLAGRADTFGRYDLKLQEPCQVFVALKGTMEAPQVQFDGVAAGGEFAFSPKVAGYPYGKLKLGAMSASWDSTGKKPSGTFTVVDGTLTQDATGLKAERISGVLMLDDARVAIDPLNAVITNNPFVGKLTYERAADKLDIVANGVFSEIENTVLGKIPGLPLRGALGVKGAFQKKGKQWVMDGSLDATQTDMRYVWWWIKPPGIGMEFPNLHCVLVPGVSAQFTSELAAMGSHASMTGEATCTHGKWLVNNVEATVDKVDVVSVGKCVHLPYRIMGGTGTLGKFAWTRAPEATREWQLTASAQFDELGILREGNETPLLCKGLEAALQIDGTSPRKARLKLNAREGHLPPLRIKWFASLDGYRDTQEPANFVWEYDLAADAVDMPPWKGTQFVGTAYTSEPESGLRSYSANTDGGGRIEGTYRNVNSDNFFTTTVRWDGMPSIYLIEELKYPHILSGLSTGSLEYSLDRDDPGTLNGKGSFEVRDGQFSADFVLSQLEVHLANKVAALPPSLKFSVFKSDVGFERDTVRTQNVELVSQGLKVSGNGSFITGGDMDYDLKVALSPEMAEKIPSIRDNFNIQGMKLAQQDIELAFKIKGPTFNPHGAVSGLPPVGVTLVSSAFEVTSDAMRVIDIPRKILTDLLKIGGGIIGVSK